MAENLSMTVEQALDLWLMFRRQRDQNQVQMDRVARVLEDRAADLGEGFARLEGQDRDGRVRFSVKGFGERTFTLQELAG